MTLVPYNYLNTRDEPFTGFIEKQATHLELLLAGIKEQIASPSMGDLESVKGRHE